MDRRRVIELRASSHRIPLPRPWGADVTDLNVVVVEVADDAGNRGNGFSWTPSIGASAIEAMVRDDCARIVVGGSTDPPTVWGALWRHLHEAGGGGITTMAMAGIDLALWDLRGRATGRSLVDLLGRRRPSVEAYGSGVNFHYSVDELEDQARRWIAAGFATVKIKVGRVDLDEDVERVGAVRRIIGAQRRLMVDANQRWDLAAARAGAQALARFEPYWLEEPILADDLRAHGELRRATSIPIAIGESLYTEYQFREAIALGACDIVQPNVVRVGGITPFLRIAEQSRRAGAVVAPHLLPELSGQLALCLDDDTMVEDVEDASFTALGVLAEPGAFAVNTGRFTADTGPGLGLSFTFGAADQQGVRPVS
jgi:L-alanine-DL-glutamate epimerase-like enolase superfamily enzyme